MKTLLHLLPLSIVSLAAASDDQIDYRVMLGNSESESESESVEAIVSQVPA